MRLLTLAIGLMIMGLAGCQSAGNESIPTVDPFAMYGHTRIAPPSTGSYGIAKRDPYYSSASEPVTNGSQAQFAAVDAQVAPAALLVDATKQPAHETNQASFQSSDTNSQSMQIASNEAPIRIVERVGPAATSHTELQGMAAVDATSHASPRLAASTSSLTHAAQSEPAQFRPVEGAATIRVLPSEETSDRPLPVRGLTPKNPSTPTISPEPTPTPILPSGTIQAGRFVPLDIATRRNNSPVGSSIAAAAN